MARSALDASIVSSTAKLMALLDLNEEPKENMDDVDIDLALDVPDTPDIFVRNDMVGDEKDFNSPVAGNSEYSELLYRGVSSRMKRHGMAIPEGSNNRTLHPQSRKDLSVHNIIELGSSPIVNSLGNTSASKNGHPEGSNNKALHPQSRKDLSVHNIIELASSPIVNSLGNTSASKNAHPFRTLEHHNPQWESEPFAQPKYAENVPSGSHSHGNDRANLSADFSGNAEESASDVRILDPSNNKVIDLMSPEICPYSIRDRNAKRKMAIWNINLDKGKGLCAEVPSRNSACVNKNGVLNLMGRRQHTGKPEKACMAKEADIGWKAVNGCSSLYDIANSPRAPSNDYNDTSKIDMQIINCTHDSNPNTRDLPVLPVQPARAGKNLSSSNIARAKQASENHGNSLVNGEQADVGGVISNGETLSCRTSIVRSDSRGRLGNHKGKGVLKDVSMAEEQSVEGMQLHSRGPVNNMEEDSGFGNGCGNAFRYFDSIGGWRNFRNRSKMASLPPFDVVDYPSRSSCRCVSRIEGDHESVVDNGSSTDLVEVSDVSALQHNPTAIAQSSSSDLSELARENGLHGLHGANKLTKWQKKEGSTSSNIGACSTSSATDSDISCLPSAVDPLTSRSIRRKNRHHRGNPGPLIVIDDFSPETRGGNSLDISRLVDNDSVARARQVEADEILAQQLQEQLYSESPGALGELDANIAWALQQEEEARPASYRGNPRSSHPRDSSMSHLYRQYPSQSFQDLPVGSANRARHPSSARTGWLRNRIRNQSPTVSSWERNFQFPPNMDFEMRIHLLEQLEATVGNSHGMRLDGHLFQRDFNENDYEMLLALDENNHQHVGASAIQINSLPQSTIQTESFEEACAICLDTPKTGEIIRHLPCLHKFHRDCIDPWLRRKRSCPICKSSVT